MSEQDATQATKLQTPTIDDKETWKAHWNAQGQPWRTEPEIDTEHQRYLAERRSIIPDIKQGIYPFKGEKLSRADVEWLLVTHESGGMHGAVDLNDYSQREREGLDLRGANLRQVDLSGLPLARMRCGLPRDEWYEATEEQRSWAAVQLQEADLSYAQLQGAILRRAQLQGAILFESQLQEANLIEGQLQGVNLVGAQLQKARLRRAQLQGAFLAMANLEGARLFRATLNDQTYGSAHLSDITWGEANLAVIDWEQVKRLGDEQVALQEKNSEGKRKDKQWRIEEYKQAVRGYRQLSAVLRGQGLNEDAARFTYRAQLMQRNVFWYQRKFGQYLFSLFLDLIAGYGYKPWRSFITYLVVIAAFATAYFIVGRSIGPALSPLGAWVFSMTSFHGRGFFPGGIGLDDPLTVLAAIEAFVGLLIEVTFIATLTQRLFGK